MENKINIAELLKDCPSGMELDCTMFEGLEFDCINAESISTPIRCRLKGSDGRYRTYNFTKYGCWSNLEYAKCVIYPKGKTTWEGFVPPCKFKDGYIVVTKTSNNFIFYSIYKDVKNRKVLTYVDYNIDSNRLMFNDDTLSSLCFIDEIVEQRLATEDEKEKLFQAIKDNGYHWNAETKTLEKLVGPEFKVGDKIKRKDSNEDIVSITDITDDYYIGETEYGMKVAISINIQNNYKLVPSKFDITTLKPFESRVLVRTNNGKWIAAFYSHYDEDSSLHYCVVGGLWYAQCIPYEGNEHLLGTTDDCDEFDKTWK